MFRGDVMRGWNRRMRYASRRRVLGRWEGVDRVDHHIQYWRLDTIVSDLHIDGVTADFRFRVINPWSPADEHLTPTQYTYRVPGLAK